MFLPLFITEHYQIFEVVLVLYIVQCCIYVLLQKNDFVRLYLLKYTLLFLNFELHKITLYKSAVMFPHPKSHHTLNIKVNNIKFQRTWKAVKTIVKTEL